MHFLLRNGIPIFDDPLPSDHILAQTDDPRFVEYVAETKRICGDYAGCKFPISYFGNVRPWDYTKILRFGEFTPEQDVLECGGLHSYFAIYLSTMVKSYTCTDSFYWAYRDYAKDANHYQTPREWCAYLIAKGKGKLWAEEADLQNLNYATESFDRVVCISVIEHVHEDRKGIDEMMRVLKPGGTLLLTTEYNPTWKKEYSETDGSYYRVYDDEGINNLLAGYNIEIKEPHSTDHRHGKFTTLFVRIRK